MLLTPVLTLYCRIFKMIYLLLIPVTLATITDATLPCPAISNGDGGLTINMSSSSISFVSRSLFVTTYDCQTSVENITRIDLSNNEISGIDDDTFAMFFNLIHLNLSHNSISDLHLDTFNQLRSLQELDLSYNFLTQLRAGLIRIVSLVSVWFNNNNISYVEPGIVSDHNVALMYFNMDNNVLTNMDPWPYLTYQTNARYIHRQFFIRNNTILEFTNNMNWTYDLFYRYEVEVFMEYNQLHTLSDSLVLQYDDTLDSTSFFTFFLTLGLNVTQNPYFCDCNLFPFANFLRSSILRYTRVEEFRYICSSPSKVAGIDWLHDLDMAELVCNATESDNCPSNCFCQDRPHNDTFLIDCTNAGLTEIPDVIPENNRSRIELILDNNAITELKDLSYSGRVYQISLHNNAIETLEAHVLENIDAVKLDFSYNKIRTLPTEIKKFSYESVSLHGNPLFCDCDSMWLKDWLTSYNDMPDTSLTCDSEEGQQTISEMTLRDLGCTLEEVIIIAIAVGVGLVLIIMIGLIFAKRCPYETKVIFNKFTCGIFHPSDKYIARENDEKEVDIYLVYDENDEDVVGWVRYFVKKLNSKKPIYSILNPARFMEPGSPAVTIPKWIGKSKRVVVVLSENIFDNKFRNMEIDDAERRVIEAASRQNGCANDVHDTEEADNRINDKGANRQNDHSGDENNANEPENITGEVGEIATGEDDNNLMNAPKLIYIKFNASNLLKTRLDNEKWQLRLADLKANRKEEAKWQEKLNEEPWKSRMANKRVLSPDEKLFWAKLRYELPSKGTGTGPDGNFVPTVPPELNRANDIEFGGANGNDEVCNMTHLEIKNENTERIRRTTDSKQILQTLSKHPNLGLNNLRVVHPEPSKSNHLKGSLFQKATGTHMNDQHADIKGRLNIISTCKNSPLNAVSLITNALSRDSDLPYSRTMNGGVQINNNGLLSSGNSSKNIYPSATSTENLTLDFSES